MLVPPPITVCCSTGGKESKAARFMVLPGLMLRLVRTTAAITGRFEDVVFLRMQLDQRFQRFVKASQFAGLGAGEHLVALPVVGHDLAVFNFEVLPEVGTHELSRDRHLFGDELRATETAANHLVIKLSLQCLALAIRFV